MTPFERDLQVPLLINNVQSSRGYWNLIVSIRDVKLWRVGMKPHRNWKVTDVKKYFGIKGSKDTLPAQLEALRDKHFPKK